MMKHSAKWPIAARLVPVLAGLLPSLAGCGGSVSPILEDRQVTVLAGDGQEAGVFALLDDVEIHVTNPLGGPAVGMPVEWEPLDGSTVPEASPYTDEQGVARAHWRLHFRPGVQRLRVVVPEAGTVELTATAHVGATAAVDVDVEPGPSIFGRHPLVTRSYDLWFNETEEDPALEWTSSDPSVAAVEGDELVIGAEGFALLRAESDLPWTHNVAVHVREEGVFLLNGWQSWLPPFPAKWDPAAEGRRARAVIHGTGFGPGPEYFAREGSWEPTEEGATARVFVGYEPGTGGIPRDVELSFRGILFPLEPGEHELDVGYYMPWDHQDRWEEWTFSVTVPE